MCASLITCVLATAAGRPLQISLLFFHRQRVLLVENTNHPYRPSIRASCPVLSVRPSVLPSSRPVCLAVPLPWFQASSKPPAHSALKDKVPTVGRISRISFGRFKCGKSRLKRMAMKRRLRRGCFLTSNDEGGYRLQILANAPPIATTFTMVFAEVSAISFFYPPTFQVSLLPFAAAGVQMYFQRYSQTFSNILRYLPALTLTLS